MPAASSRRQTRRLVQPNDPGPSTGPPARDDQARDGARHLPHPGHSATTGDLSSGIAAIIAIPFSLRPRCPQRRTPSHSATNPPPSLSPVHRPSQYLSSPGGPGHKMTSLRWRVLGRASAPRPTLQPAKLSSGFASHAGDRSPSRGRGDDEIGHALPLFGTPAVP